MNFRSYPLYEMELDSTLTVIHGPNAAGKTNLIEAIQLVTEGASFRSPQWGDLVTWGAESATVSLSAHEGARLRKVSLSIKEGRRQYEVNGKTVRAASSVTGAIPAVVFTPNDLRIIKDSSDKRRDEIDALGAQLSPAYRRLRTDYQKAVSQRNRLLKDGIISAGSLSAWSERVADLGSQLLAARLRLLARMEPHIAAAFRGIDDAAEVQVNYEFGWPIRAGVEWREYLTIGANQQRELLIGAIDTSREQELSRGVTLVGPHRDDISFLVDGKNIRVFGSQGQQRSVALAWKLGEVATIREVSGDNPILLLDDVMSELDDRRRSALAQTVGTAAQTVVTTANIGYFTAGMLDRARIIEVRA